MNLIIYKITTSLYSTFNKIRDGIVRGTFRKPYSLVKRKGSSYIVQPGNIDQLDLGINIINRTNNRPIFIYVEEIGVQEEITEFTEELCDNNHISTYSSDEFLDSFSGFDNKRFDSLDIFYNYLNNYFRDK